MVNNNLYKKVCFINYMVAPNKEEGEKIIKIRLVNYWSSEYYIFLD